MEVPAAAFVVLVKEVLGVVRAALVDWTLTARLCVLIIVVAAATCTTGLLFR
jgi:hypothetical protein